MSFITHRASRQGTRKHQGKRVVIGSNGVSPFLSGDTRILDHGNTKKQRLKPAEIGGSDSNGLVIRGTLGHSTNVGQNPDGATPATDGDSLRNPDFPISYAGLGTLAFVSPVKIPTIIGPVNILGDVYSNGSLLGGGSDPNIVAVNITSTTANYDATVGTAIGTLSAMGGTAPIAFSIILDADSKFQTSGILNEVLEVGAAFDYFTNESHSVTIRATDVNAKTFDQIFTINLVVPAYTSIKCLDINNATTNEYLKLTGVSGTAIDTNNSAFTVSYWINCPDNSAYSHIQLTTAGAYRLFTFNNGTGGDYIRCQIYDAAGIRDDFGHSSVNWSDDTWHHMCFTYGTNNPNIYIDGVVRTKNYFSNGAMTDPLRPIDEIIVGSRNTAPSATPDAKFDEVTIWSVEMDAAQVAELYNSGSQNFHPLSHSVGKAALLAWWKMEGLNGSDQVVDYGPHGYHLPSFNIDASNFIAP